MVWKRFQKRSISQDLTISLMVLMIVFEGILVAVVYEQQARSLFDQLNGKAEDYTQYLSEVLVVPIWDFDDEQIETIGAGFARNELVDEVRITDGDDNVLFTEVKRTDTDRQIVRRFDIRRSGQIIGQVRFHLSMDAYHTDLKQLQNTILMVLIVSLVIIAVTTGTLLRIFMRRPLRMLQKGIDRLAQGDYAHGFSEVHHSELADIAERFRQMADEIQSRERFLQQEVAERKRAEEKSRESEAKSLALLDAIPDLMFQFDRDGYYRDYRGPTDDLYLPPEEFLGKHLRDVLPPDIAELFEKKIEEVMFTGSGWVFDYELDVAGETLYFECRMVAIDDEQVLAIVRNISDRVKASAEKQRLEAQLRRAQKMEAIGALAGGVAHDLNNVLSGLVSYPELLLMQVDADSPLRGPIETIQASGEKAAHIVQDLLTLARRSVPAAEIVDMNRIVTDYLESPEFDLLRHHHPEIVVELALDPHLLPTSGSPLHLSKTIMNLVLNAFEAIEGKGTGRTQGRVSVQTENRYIDRPVRGYDDITEGDYVVLTVSDNGIGITREDINHIFEPFYTKKVMGRSGTGLGMAVVWGAVKDHNGYIDVRSEATVGTDITIYFPASREAHDAEMAAAEADAFAGGGERILVVDDIPEQREIASEMLTRIGYSVQTVDSGEAAVAYLHERGADLVVLDMIMEPGIDGLETYRRILEIHPGQKAIITSGYSESSRVRTAKSLGVGTYLKKPYLIKQLGMAIRQELAK